MAKKANIMVLKKIGVLPLAKIYAILMLIIALLVDIVYLVLSIFDSTFWLGMDFIYLPILYLIFGFVVGGVGAFLYNFITTKTSGVELEFE